MKRIIRNRHLTSEEAAKYNAIREEIAEEEPEISARVRARMATGRLPAGEETLIQEQDNIVLTMDLPKYGLRNGDIGEVVTVHGDHGYEVEFVALDGQTVAVVSLGLSQARPIQAGEIAHVRSLSAASSVAS